jgi:glycosyltransferase involved in cell wall biosynthesis
MKIGILGTRGIPNRYGGFEQFAEFFSKYLAQKEYEVYVYNSSSHPYKEVEWNGVNIIHKSDPEDKIGTVGQFIYDLNCILDTRKRNFDVIFQLGYTSSSIWNWLLPKNSKIITNMDGLEWKRSKYSAKVQKFIKFAEKLALKHSDILVSDSIGIKKYLMDTYCVESVYIPYGVNTQNDYDDTVLIEHHLEKFRYNMLIARIEPENNIEVILDGVKKANKKQIFLVVGKANSSFGSYLVNKFKDERNILFVGAIYNLSKLNSLRRYSNLYFHGHSVGGTNPSLLEAMASHTLICAHDNIFNKAILEKDAFYFSDYEDVIKVLNNVDKGSNEDFVVNSYKKAVTDFNWDKINSKYEKLIQ